MEGGGEGNQNALYTDMKLSKNRFNTSNRKKEGKICNRPLMKQLALELKEEGFS